MRPQHVAQGDRGGAGPLQLVGVGDAAAERGVDLGGVGVELVEPGRDRGDQLVVVDEGEHAGQAVQRGVDGAGARPSTARTSPRAASAASSPPSSSAAVGVGRVGGRLTMPTMPHMARQATDGRRPARAAPRGRIRQLLAQTVRI